MKKDAIKRIKKNQSQSDHEGVGPRNEVEVESAHVAVSEGLGFNEIISSKYTQFSLFDA